MLKKITKKVFFCINKTLECCHGGYKNASSKQYGPSFKNIENKIFIYNPLTEIEVILINWIELNGDMLQILFPKMHRTSINDEFLKFTMLIISVLVQNLGYKLLLCTTDWNSNRL